MAGINEIAIASLRTFDTPPVKAGTAAHQVFAIVELTENILAQGLRPVQLFAMKRVCRDFNTVITNSTTMQKKMFILHEHDGSNASTPISMNPFFSHWRKMLPTFAACFTYKKDRQTGRWVFSLSAYERYRDIDTELKKFLKSDTSGAADLKATKVANIPLKLSGVIDMEYYLGCGEKYCSLQCKFDLSSCTTLEAMMVAFVKELAHLIEENKKDVEVRWTIAQAQRDAWINRVPGSLRRVLVPI